MKDSLRWMETLSISERNSMYNLKEMQRRLPRCGLENTGVLESVLENRFFHSSKHESDICCVGRLCQAVSSKLLDGNQRLTKPSLWIDAESCSIRLHKLP